MATVEELLRAAKKADAAGDTDAARKLMQLAKTGMGVGKPSAADPANPLMPPRTSPMGPAPDMTPGATGPMNTAKDMAAEPWAATKEYASGIMNPRESAVGKSLAESGAYIPGISDLSVGIMNAGGAALSGLHAAMAGGAGAVADATGALGASEDSQQRLANDLMGMAESTAGTMPLATTEVASARAALKADEKLNSAAGAAKELGITPSLGMTGKTGGMAAATLEKVPFAADMVAKDAARAVGEVEGAFRKVISGGLSPSSAGELLQKGLVAFVEKFQKRSSELYDNVAKYIPQGKRVQLDKTRGTITAFQQHFAENPALAKKLGLDKWNGVIAEMQAPPKTFGREFLEKNGVDPVTVFGPAKEGGMSWAALSAFRTEIGKAIGQQTGELTDVSMARLKQLYGALTADMEAAAKAAGPKAYQAWTRANGFYKSGAKRMERSLDSTINATHPERAFEAFDALTQADRSTADIVRMRQIKASLSRDDWTQISESIADRLGKAKSGAQNADGNVFSPATFLTEWNKMSPDARRILFDEPVRIELEKIAKVSEAVKAGQAERNFSNTGTLVWAAALLKGFAVAPISTTVAVTGTMVSAKAMTSPIFLRAVNRAMSGDAKAIEAMARGKGPYAEDAALLMRMAASETQMGGAANSPEPPRAVINR